MPRKPRESPPTTGGAATKATRQRKERRDWKPAFLRAMEKHGVVVDACRSAGIYKTTAYRHREKDPAFAAAWDDAVDSSTQELESACMKRALGFKQVIMTKAGPAEVDAYSDTLAIFLLKARRPDVYREPRGVVVNVQSQAEPAHPADAAAGIAAAIASKQAREAEGTGS